VARRRFGEKPRSNRGGTGQFQRKLIDPEQSAAVGLFSQRTNPLPLTPEALIGPLSQLEAKFAPSKIFVSGPLKLPLYHPRVSVIGTRTPTEDGLKIARTLASSLARRGVLVVSGLARGIDTAAHSAAIDSAGRTLAVLGTPLSKAYPSENAALQALIAHDHLVVSQFEEGRPVLPRNFILRNRTMALISDATVIVESGDGGGSLHQGWEALRLGRPLFIHAREFGRSGIEWPRKMADYGAVEFSKPSDVLEAVPRSELGLGVPSPLPT
jgi:DNA processing protein